MQHKKVSNGVNPKIKIFTAGFALIFGALLLVGAGCSNKNVTDNTDNNAGDQDTLNDGGPGAPAGEGEEDSADVYGSAEEIAVPTGLASELKSIFSEVCGGAKLTTLDYDFPAQGADMLVYVWKNKPTEEKLKNAFERNEYIIEEAGNGIINIKKGNLYITIDWDTPDREDGQEIVVLTAE